MVSVVFPSEDNNNKITVRSEDGSYKISTKNSIAFNENLSRAWAVKMDGMVLNEDYSSKYYANKSQESAISAQTSATNASETYTQLQATASQALENISNTEETSIANINTVKDDSLTEIETLKNASISEMETIADEGITELNTTKDDVISATSTSLSSITNLTTQSKTEIETAKTTAVNTVNTTKDNAITQITQESAKQVALATEQANIATEQSTIATNKTSEVVASGDKALSNIDIAKTGAITDITTIKDNAITSITNQETTSKTSLINEGATQVLLIQNEGATQVANVQSTGFYMRDDKLYFINSEGEEEEFKSGGGAHIGQTVFSLLPIVDAGVHLLDGTLLNGDGIYSGFVNYIKTLDLTASYFCTEEDWQTSVTNYGVCGKFVYDSVNNTVRLPKVTGIVEGTIDANALGDLVEAGLPNITGNIRSFEGGWIPTGAFYIDSTENNAPASGTNTNMDWIRFAASRSSSIYGNSTTVQPQTIKGYYYIVVATSTKTDIEVDIDNVVTDLNGKADVDFSNVNSTGTSLASGWSMPSSRYIDLTLGATMSTYTAPANGWYCLYMSSNGTTGKYVSLFNEATLLGATTCGSTGWQPLKVFIPVKKGDVVKVEYTATTTGFFRFYYAQGEEV